MDVRIMAAAQQSGWLGIAAGDWLSAITSMMAIVIGVVIAARIAPGAAERAARRDQRERLLRILLSTWLVPANAEYQGAISLVRIDFKGCKTVLDALSSYLDSANEIAPTDAEGLAAQGARTVAKQADLIAAIAQELDFDLTSEALQKGAYLSRGFVEREMLTMEAMRAWPRIADALERNNHMFAWSLDNSVHLASAEHDKDKQAGA